MFKWLLIFLIYLIGQLKSKEDCDFNFYSMFYYNHNFYIVTNLIVHKFDYINFTVNRYSNGLITKKKDNSAEDELILNKHIEFKLNKNSNDQTTNYVYAHRELFRDHLGIVIGTDFYLNILTMNNDSFSKLPFRHLNSEFEFKQKDNKQFKNFSPKYLGKSWGLHLNGINVYLIRKDRNLLQLDYNGTIKNESIDYNVVYASFIPNNQTSNLNITFYALILDDQNNVRFYLIYSKPDIVFFKKLSLYDLVQCKRNLCDNRFNLKGYTYFDAIDKYAYFVDNCYLLSDHNLIDLINEGKL